MIGGISVHVVDVTRGLSAAGMKVEIFQLGVPEPVASGVISSKGTLDHPIAHGETVEAGTHEALFYVGAFYRQLGYVLPARPFLDVVPFRFGIDAIEQHYHLPLKVSPGDSHCFKVARKR
jgi:5-hydroxyisourate hydrolase